MTSYTFVYAMAWFHEILKHVQFAGQLIPQHVMASKAQSFTLDCTGVVKEETIPL